MKKSIYKSYEELPLMLNADADAVKAVLGISISSAYELMHEKDFPVLKGGSRMVVPKEKFIQWVQNHTRGGRGNPNGGTKWPPAKAQHQRVWRGNEGYEARDDVKQDKGERVRVPLSLHKRPQCGRFR